ncbi:putative transcription factor interactor and regulator CCHC(Zn) family [Senna tora]|uniref:Putative transcription factor interactor and regulator CCHC(Zn) family n=1 Tax=Senna tora TaxID=362788 RepID=A0A835CHW8_9FABA|nr:putative transcription factor interactor and regulator CCHC(Zn) family [Senna tora]
MVNVASRLGDLNTPVTDSFLVNHALNSLPSKFNSLKTSYVAQKEVWDVNTMISICAQEEEHMKLTIEEVASVMSENDTDHCLTSNITSSKRASPDDVQTVELTEMLIPQMSSTKPIKQIKKKKFE